MRAPLLPSPRKPEGDQAASKTNPPIVDAAIRAPLLPTPKKPERDQAASKTNPRIVLMESISERERPLRHRMEQVDTLKTILRAAIWVTVLLATLGVLAWRMKIV